MGSLRRSLFRLLAVLLPVAIGGATIALSQASRTSPQLKPAAERAQSVRVMTLEEMTYVPRVIGYGSVTPAREWRAVARIDGDVVWTAEDLANGSIVEEGAELLRIDDSDLRLSLARIDAQLAALDVKDEATRASIVISEENLALAQAELDRLEDLSRRDVVSRANVEQAERQLVAGRGELVNLKNQIALNAAEREVLNAERRIAERSLDHVSIRAPYALRIGEVEAEIGQFVNRGQTLLSGEGIDAVEVTAQFPIGKMAPLVAAGEARQRGPLALDAIVRLRAPGHVIEWPAQVDRVSDAIDLRTQSVAIVAVVDRPVAQARPGERPALRRNMFVEVELRAAERAGLLVPAGAIHEGSVLIATAEDSLEIRDVEVEAVFGAVAVVASGLESGERLVLSELPLPVPGIALAPIEDEASKAELASLARGQEEAR